MSANNWTRCPRCYDQKVQSVVRADKLEREAQLQYGKVSAEEYIALVKRASDKRLATADELNRFEQTFREDYDIGLSKETGNFVVRYTGRCSVCGLKVDFKHEQEVKV